MTTVALSRADIERDASAPLLELRSASKQYKQRGGDSTNWALRDLSLIFPADHGTITALVGESGSGKTTAGRLALGLIAPTEGEVLYIGTPLNKMKKGQQRMFRREVQVIAQDPYSAFNPFYHVGHIFAVVRRRLGVYEHRRAANDALHEVLDFVGLGERDMLSRYPHELSGGERQRLMVARALYARPRLIVADEPVSMVDANLRLQILELIERVRSEFGISFLYISHDLSTVYRLASDLVVMQDGHPVEQGSARKIIEQPSHPYTQALLDATPSPDPSIRW